MYAELFEKYRATDLQPTPGHVTNFLGLVTKADLFGHGGPLAGKVITGDPVPSDQLYGGMHEYASILDAIDRAPDRSTFTAVELGAAWGPWISAVGVVCKRMGYRQINLVGVEASETKAQSMHAHLERNGLLNQPNVRADVIAGAAGAEDGTLYFPDELPMTDLGAAAAQRNTAIDYRGFQYRQKAVKAYSLETLCRPFQVVDFMHWDIQGAEAGVALASITVLQKKCRAVFIGTHSRAIEGDLVRLFYELGWDLIYQTPCSFKYDREKPSLEGMTTTDGEMYWRNPRLYPA